MSLTRQLRIIIAGGTGHLGTILARHFHEQGHVVSTVTRFPKPYAWESVHWDAENLGYWASSFEGADAVINLAGRSLHHRHTASNKQAILSSRVRMAELVSEAIGQCVRPPRVWLNAGLANIFCDVTKASEAVVYASHTAQTRKVCLRMAPVMSIVKGKAFDNWLRLVRLGLGGEVGNGEQYVSWIHDFDFIRALEFLIDQDIAGPVNIAAPNPVPNHQFMCNIRRAWCTSYFGLPLPEWLIRTSAFVSQTEPDLILKSRRVFPRRLLDARFTFHFPEWRGACENLVERWRFLHD